MGTGVGEAMLIGAVTGAGTSAITGGDPLKGALFGLAGGAMGPMLGSALGGSAAGAGSATAGQVAGQLGVQGAATGLGSQSAMLANQLAGMGAEGLSLTGQAAASALPSNVMPAAINQAAGTAISQAPLPNIADVPKTGFTDIFKSTPGGPDFGQRVGNYLVQNPTQAAMSGSSLANMMFNPVETKMPGEEKYDGPLSRFRYDPSFYRPAYAGGGGITDLDLGSASRLSPSPVMMMASGGISHLGSYSDGGRLLKGPGDGMSDSIPAKIGRRQPARLADGEFVVPADVVSHLGNGSTDAGAKQLYAMMDKVRRARTGNQKQGREINPRKFVPA